MRIPANPERRKTANRGVIMERSGLTLEISDEIVSAVKLPPKEVECELRKELGLALYMRGTLSFGKARKLAQLTHWEFDDLLGHRKIVRHYTDADLKEDIKYADGEVEVIALAVECKADMILLDESEARRIANIYGLSKTGAIGILIRAKREGYIRSLKDELDKLRKDGGFWIDEAFYRELLVPEEAPL